MSGQSDSDLTCDVVVIGAGTSGLAAERAARKGGARTLLIDEAFAGTVCASVGCMPSKLLIAAAHSAHSARNTDIFGVRVAGVGIDGPAVMRRLRRERDAFVAGALSSIDDIPDGIKVRARARFVGPGTLELDDGRHVAFQAAVIATGSSARVPKPFAELGERIKTNRDIFEIEDLPDSLAVIGGGAIGLELAQAMGRLGVKVTLFDRETTLGKARDTQVHQALAQAVSRDVDLKLGVDLTPSADKDGIRLEWSGDHQGSAVFNLVLVAAGRPPNLKDLGLEAAGLKLDDRGTPVFDRQTLQCGDAPIFIVGDANADLPILHEASLEGAIAGENAARFPDVTSAGRDVMFTLTFTDPPLASIGDDPGKADLTGRVDYADQGRAKVEARAEGCVLIGADRTGRLTGAEICAPGGEHLAHLLAWAVQQRSTAQLLLSMPFYHPTLEEGLKSALRAICRAASLPEPDLRDSGTAPGS